MGFCVEYWWLGVILEVGWVLGRGWYSILGGRCRSGGGWWLGEVGRCVIFCVGRVVVGCGR